jgi:ABC-type transport system involved in multi-copper enzyme maturation permease subunit
MTEEETNEDNVVVVGSQKQDKHTVVGTSSFKWKSLLSKASRKSKKHLFESAITVFISLIVLSIINTAISQVHVGIQLVNTTSNTLVNHPHSNIPTNVSTSGNNGSAGIPPSLFAAALLFPVIFIITYYVLKHRVD